MFELDCILIEYGLLKKVYMESKCFLLLYGSLFGFFVGIMGVFVCFTVIYVV